VAVPLHGFHEIPITGRGFRGDHGHPLRDSREGQFPVHFHDPFSPEPFDYLLFLPGQVTQGERGIDIGYLDAEPVLCMEPDASPAKDLDAAFQGHPGCRFKKGAQHAVPGGPNGGPRPGHDGFIIRVLLDQFHVAVPPGIYPEFQDFGHDPVGARK